MALTRITEVHATDGRNIEIAFVVKDERGAIHFHFRADEIPRDEYEGWLTCAGVETHYATPKAGYCERESCHYLDGKPCWHSGTSLWARERWIPGFRHGGTDWVWSALEMRHAETFYPTDEEST